MRKCFATLFVGILAGVVSITPAAAQSRATSDNPASTGMPSPFVLQRLTGPITLDGFSNEPAWQAITPLPLVQYQPVYEGAFSDSSEIRIAYDNDYLYISGKLYDSHPGGMRANTLYRDRYSGDDTFAIILDTFDDNENALWFMTTPSGVRFDMTVSNDAEFTGGSAFGEVVNNSWDTFWDVRSVQTDEGWFAEFRIPYSSLGFQSINGRVEMGMIVYRYISHSNERHIFPDIPPNWGMGFAKPSQAQTIVLTGVESKKPVYITPYVTGGLGQVSALNDAGSAYDFNRDTQRDAGLDLKYAITNNLTLDATVNTDFAQVEADDEQVNLTRFSLFFPEKRQFFQERAGIFNFSTGRLDRVFHSRRIGLNRGKSVRILGGGRMVGRVGMWDIGVINMQTESTGSLPSENFGVYRLRRRLLNQESYAGALVTTRLGNDGNYNVVYGLDSRLKVSTREYVTMKWIQTAETDPLYSRSFDFLESSFARLQVERRGDIGLGFNSAVSFSGRDYNPGIGFVLRRGFISQFADLSYGWFTSEQSPIRKITPSVFLSTFFRVGDGTLESLRGSHNWSIDMKSGATMRASASVQVEDLTREIFFPGNTSVPTGRYTFATFQTSYKVADGNKLRGRHSASIGTFYDGWRAQVNVAPVWNVSRYLELSAGYQYSRLEFSKRGQSANVHLVSLRSQIGLNTRVSLNSLLQYNQSANLFAANVRFRYNFSEGNDLWIVFNQNMNTDRFRQEPALPLTSDRTILVKYTYTLGI